MTAPNTETPNVAAYVESNHATGQRYAYVSCPFCQDRHMHGAGSTDGPADLGYRASHCLTGAGGSYRLVRAPADMPKPAALSRRERHKRLEEDDRRRGHAQAPAAQPEPRKGARRCYGCCAR